jgi:hypothetical protein
VVSVDQKAGKFFIAPVATTVFSKTTRYDERTYNTDKKLELKAGKDFHTLTSVKDDRVEVNYNNGSGVVMRGVEGRVVGFDPGTMSYTVAVPQVTVPIGQVSRMNRSEKAWHKRGSGVPSQFDKPLVGKHIMMRAGQEWTSGRILGFSPKTEAAATLRDYSYTLLSDDGVQQNNAEWPRDWHEPAGFAQATDVQANWKAYPKDHKCEPDSDPFLERESTSLTDCKALCASTPPCVGIQHTTAQECSLFKHAVTQGAELTGASCYAKVGTLSTVFLHDSHADAERYLKKHRTWSQSHFGGICANTEACDCFNGGVYKECE